MSKGRQCEYARQSDERGGNPFASKTSPASWPLRIMYQPCPIVLRQPLPRLFCQPQTSGFGSQRSMEMVSTAGAHVRYPAMMPLVRHDSAMTCLPPLSRKGTPVRGASVGQVLKGTHVHHSHFTATEKSPPPENLVALLGAHASQGPPPGEAAGTQLPLSSPSGAGVYFRP
jgi:hypothetical protein